VIRTLLGSKVLAAVLLGVSATVLAWIVWVSAGGTLTAIERSPYDSWLRTRPLVPVSPAVVMVSRDAASDGRFGAGEWDRALLARAISALRNAGAVVVGVDIPISEPSTPAQGGAASDALLVHATETAGGVVFPLPVQLSPDQLPHEDLALWQVVPTAGALPVLAHHAKGLGHTLSLADEDGMVRKIPLYVLLGDLPLPAFGFALAQAFFQLPPAQVRHGGPLILRDAKFPDRQFKQLTIPLDRHGQILISYTKATTGAGFQIMSFLDLWKAIEEGEGTQLRERVGGKVVLLLLSTARTAYATPVGQRTVAAVHADLLNTILTRSWFKETSPPWGLVVGFVLASLAAWLSLVVPGWKGLAAVVTLIAGYLGMVFLALPIGAVLLPVCIPFAALIAASGSATLWLQLSSAQQMKVLEASMGKVQQELAAVRGALIRQESGVEDLEEDLEVARSAAARSAGKEKELSQSAEALRAQVVEAKAEEQRTRERLAELEGVLRGLRAATPEPARLGTAELERLRHECGQMGIITGDPAMVAMFRDIKKGARSPLSILILGEPGTGKELFARAVHRLSPRAAHPFVSVNMAALSPHLFESELFGHQRGSFTGAIADRKGYFEQAHLGTIFLDEVGDLQLEHQGKLLRVLQEKTFYRVGATRPTTVDVRVVAATNKDLLRGVSEGWFREDLYFRLKGLVLSLPPLRERPRDVALLAEQFLRDFASHGGRDGLALSADALAALEAHRWRGNIRELQHCLQQAVALAEGPLITKEGLRLASPEDGTGRGPVSDGLTPDSGSDQEMLACLREQGFDMQATARALGCDRSTVTQRLKGMGFQALVASDGDRAKAAMTLAGDPTLAHTVELKLVEYHKHLLQVIEGYDSAEEAVAACKKRYKNLPDRHFRSVETLIRQFHRAPS
jgi:transcriptional regulator with GAF, ATPase, and Fis domain/CHASE2 domain-containing sensor protein